MLTRRSFIENTLSGATGAILAPHANIIQSATCAYDASRPYAQVASKNGISPYASPHVTAKEDAAANSKRILIVVDYQVDFVDGGVFGSIEPAIALEDALCDTIQKYLDNEDIIIYTMDTHPSDEYLATREGAVNPQHCDPQSEGWQLYGKVRELINPNNAILVKKGTYGAKTLPSVVQNILDQGTEIEYIEFAGVSTTCRVLHNAILIYNFFPELPLLFDDSTTASYTDERTVEQLDELEAWGFIVKRTNERLKHVEA